MTEKEKMLAGELHKPGQDAELYAERLEAKALCRVYNDLPVSDEREQQKIIAQLFGRVGQNPVITAPFYCDYGYNIQVGNNFYMNHGCVILDCAPVVIGDNVLFGPLCGVYTVGHPLNVHQRQAGMEFARQITIGNTVWIGGHVVIMPGVTIGDNSVIGAGSVVTRDIPAGVIAMGSPCRVQRSLTAEELGHPAGIVC